MAVIHAGKPNFRAFRIVYIRDNPPRLSLEPIILTQEEFEKLTGQSRIVLPENLIVVP